jgi:hypothetical protein
MSSNGAATAGVDAARGGGWATAAGSTTGGGRGTGGRTTWPGSKRQSMDLKVVGRCSGYQEVGAQGAAVTMGGPWARSGW